MNLKEGLTYPEMRDLLSRVELFVKEAITPEQKRLINKKILQELRGLDHISRGKLITLMTVLSLEQLGGRKGYKENLYGLVSLIDQLETEIKEAEQQETDK